ncbi:MAG: hypothetical protein PHU94_01395 [Bacilli bacterium]|nr:hypothetical protein [Bacilli bacterium]
MKIFTTKKNLISLIIILYLVAVGISFAYFTANITGSETSTTLNVEGGTMNITYNGGSNISIFNIYPREEVWATKTFTVIGNNTTNIDMLYSISIVIQSNTFSSGALRYKFISINNGSNGVVIPSVSTMRDIGTGVSNIKLGNGSFTGSTGGNKIHTYNLEIYFPDIAGNQNAEQGKQLNAYIKVDKDSISTNGLVLSYDANGKTNQGTDKGIFHDLSGSGNNGTLKNFGYTSTSGWTGTGLKFDGLDDYVAIPTLGLSNSNFTYQINDQIISFRGNNVALVKNNNIDIGGRNLLPNTYFRNKSIKYEHINKAGEGGFRYSDIKETLVQGQQYTITMRVRGNARIVLYRIASEGNSSISWILPTDINENTYTEKTLTFEPHKPTLTALYIYTAYRTTAYTEWFEIEPGSLKLEKGIVATTWSPAPEDITGITKLDHNLPYNIDNIINSIRFYNRSLTDEEIMYNYNL